jgi:hypothetical protein
MSSDDGTQKLLYGFDVCLTWRSFSFPRRSGKASNCTILSA